MKATVHMVNRCAGQPRGVVAAHTWGLEDHLRTVFREFGELARDFEDLGLLPPGSDRTTIIPALTELFEEALQEGLKNLSFSSLSANLGKTMYKARSNRMPTPVALCPPRSGPAGAAESTRLQPGRSERPMFPSSTSLACTVQRPSVGSLRPWRMDPGPFLLPPCSSSSGSLRSTRC